MNRLVSSSHRVKRTLFQVPGRWNSRRSLCSMCKTRRGSTCNLRCKGQRPFHRRRGKDIYFKTLVLHGIDRPREARVNMTLVDSCGCICLIAAHRVHEFHWVFTLLSSYSLVMFEHSTEFSLIHPNLTKSVEESDAIRSNPVNSAIPLMSHSLPGLGFFSFALSWASPLSSGLTKHHNGCHASEVHVVFVGLKYIVRLGYGGFVDMIVCLLCSKQRPFTNKGLHSL
jgi:hypothetical protein